VFLPLAISSSLPGSRIPSLFVGCSSDSLAMPEKKTKQLGSGFMKRSSAWYFPGNY
jgi:hypothetical protein